VSRRLPRLAFSSSAAALALVVALPTAALASEQADHSGGDHGKSGQNSHSKQAKHAAENGSQANDTDGHNPPGNNGTIKIDYAAPADSGNANRPHPGCAFQLRMFGFDDDQYGTVTFVGQAPTKLGTLLTQQHVLLSDDAAGGGQDVDAVYSYTAQQLGLLGKPQAKQGWHVKVSVDADDAPGGAKHKVFWLTCDQAAAAAPTVSTTSVENAGTATQAAGTTVTTAGAPSGAAATTVVTSGSAAGAAALGATTTSRSSALSRGTTSGAAAGVARGAAPAASAAGAGLPFTGIALGSLIALALGALAAGGLAIRAGRRRTAL
jgi:hypothetical protein